MAGQSASMSVGEVKSVCSQLEGGRPVKMCHDAETQKPSMKMGSKKPMTGK